MRKSKIVQSIGLVMVVLSLLVIMLSISVSATSQGSITFSCTEFDSVRGETFTTTVYAQEGSNVTGLDLTLTYNSEYVTLESYDVVRASEVNVNGNTIEIHYADADNVTTKLELVELTFSVDDNLAAGLYSDWLVWSNNSEDDAFTTTGFNNGTPQYEDLTIETAFPALFIRQQGDAYNNNYDGKVNARDASYILQHAAHMFTMPAVDQRYANVYTNDNLADGTAKISARDASLILQYAAHMDVTLSDRFNVTFYALDESGNYTVQVVKSVKKGSNLTKLPAVLSMGEGKEGSWSANAEGFATPNFTNITESFSVYAHYEDAVFSITYDYDPQKGAYADGVSNKVTYTDKDSFTLNDLVAKEGYIFDGWYNNYGDKVMEIKTGTTGDITLKAKWTLSTYTITYDCGSGNNSSKNVSTYDIEDDIIFSDATHEKYLFNGWTDANGNPITKIEKGTTGNLELTANWRAARNIAHPISTISNPKYKTSIIAQKGDEVVFIYYLGYIDNVPLDSISSPYYHNGGNHSKTLSTTQATAESISKATTDATEKTRSWQSEVKIGSETTIGKDSWPVKEKISVEVSHNQSGSTVTSHEESKTTTFSQEQISATSDTHDWTSNDPKGWYRYVNYATIDVFAVIMYNAVGNEYYVGNVNAVRDIGQMWDYSATSSTFDDDIYGELPFEVPDEVYEYVNNLTVHTQGLLFNENVVVAYNGSDTAVVLPVYKNGYKVTSFESNLFAGNTSITSVTFGEGITYIPDGAFEGCTSLKSVVFNGKLTEIGANAFKGCGALEFEIPDTVTSIGDAAFDGCEAIDNVKIPNTITSLGTAVFNNCGDLSLTVQGNDLTLIQAAVSSGATNVYIDWIYEEATVDANCTLTVPSIQAFKFDGNLQAFNNLCIVSDAIDTTIEYVKIINSTGENALTFASTNVNLRAMTVESNKTALALSADSVDLIIGGTVTLTAKNGCDGVSANALNISAAVSEAATLNINGGDGNPGGNGMTINGDLQLNGFITVTVTAGDGTRNGNDGANGGIGISANNIVLNTSSSTLITVTGGAGGTAYNRSSGDNGGDGHNGRDGYAGGAGGVAIKATNITVNSGKLSVIGGIGGEGGDGSECNYAYGKEVRGGTGGKGGDGSVAIFASSFIVNGQAEKTSINVVGGSGGQTGRRGGCHENDHGDGWADLGWAKDGYEGTAGSGASAFSDECVVTDSSNIIVAASGTDGMVDTSLNQS